MIKSSLLLLTVIALTVSLFATTANAQMMSTNAGLGIQGSQVTVSANAALGTRGSQVISLQKFLNTCVATQVNVAGKTGGSGMETSYYGPATKNAVTRFQLAHGISPVGSVGPITRAKIEMLQANGSPCSTTTSTTTGGTLNATPPKAANTSECIIGMAYSPITGNKCSTTTVTPIIGGTSVVENPSICTISSFSTNRTLIGKGDSATLSWSTLGCIGDITVLTTPHTFNTTNGISSSSEVVDRVKGSGSMKVTPQQTTSYTLRANQQSKTVTVTVGPEVLDTSPVETCKIKFSADDTSLNQGESTTLRWVVTGCKDGVELHTTEIIPLIPSTQLTTRIEKVNSSGTLTVTPSVMTKYVITTPYSQNGIQSVIILVKDEPNCIILDDGTKACMVN